MTNTHLSSLLLDTVGGSLEDVIRPDKQTTNDADSERVSEWNV